MIWGKRVLAAGTKGKLKPEGAPRALQARRPAQWERLAGNICALKATDSQALPGVSDTVSLE